MISLPPKNTLIQCTIKRDRSGLKLFYPEYHLYLSYNYTYLMSAKKWSIMKRSNYLMSSDKTISRNSLSYIGNLRSNFLGTEFTIYDNGESPEKCKDFNKIRSELGLILYESNILGTRGPRKMKVIIPDCKQNSEQPISYKPKNENEGLILNHKIGKNEGVRTFINKPPKWNEQYQAFVLNFNGRVDKPSVKNFQLIEEKNEDVIYMQFGRVGPDVFNVDFQYPLSPLQAFSIAMSSFDYKLACE